MALDTSAREAQPISVPEPLNAWIRYRYPQRHWPKPERPWVDLVKGAMEGPLDVGSQPQDLRPAPPRLIRRSYDDVVYLPPVPRVLRLWRARLVEELQRQGCALCVQWMAADLTEHAADDSDLDHWVDWTTEVVSGGLVDGSPQWLAQLRQRSSTDGALRRRLAGSWWIVPLLPVAVEPHLEELAELAQRTAAGGVLLVACSLGPAQRRALARSLDQPVGGRQAATVSDCEVEISEDTFAALFHRAWPDLDDANRRLEERGVETICQRPLPAAPEGLRSRREASGVLTAVAEMRRRRGGVESRNQELVRAALWLDRNEFDLAGWMRDGHLRVVDAIDGEARELLESWAQRGAAAVLQSERSERSLDLSR